MKEFPNNNKEFRGSLEGNKTLEPVSIEVYEREIHKTIVGQDEAVHSVAELYASLVSGVRKSRRGPLAVKYLVGPSGVGKTELVYAFAAMFLDRNKDQNTDMQRLNQQQEREKFPARRPQYPPSSPQLIEDFDSRTLAQTHVMKIDGGAFGNSHEVAKLLGSPPGYLGHNETSPYFSTKSLEKSQIYFRDNLGNNRFLTIILMDEAEKMNATVHMAMLGVLDKGELTDGANRVVDFNNTVIFYTANVGNREVERFLKDRKPGFLDNTIINPDTKNKTIENMYIRKLREAFPPEFMGRIQEVVCFKHLKHEEIRAIVFLILEEFEHDLSKSGIHGVDLQISPKAIELLISKGYDPSEGARKIRKVMEKLIFESVVRFPFTEIINTTLVVDINASSGGVLEFYSISREKAACVTN